jgi:hypothetical protein
VLSIEKKGATVVRSLQFSLSYHVLRIYPWKKYGILMGLEMSML